MNKSFKKFLIYNLGFLLYISLTGCLATTKDTEQLQLSVQQLQKQVNELKISYEKFNKTVQQNQAKLKLDQDQQGNDQQVLAEKLEGTRDELSRLSQRLDDLEAKVSQGASLSFPKQPVAAALAPVPESLPSATTVTVTAPLASLTTVPKPESMPTKVLSPTDLYQVAYNDYVNKNYDLAIQGFSDYLKKYPQTELSPSSQYWIGECYYSKAEFDKAITEFNKVVNSYPRSAKVPAAKLKAAFSLYELNKKDEAIKMLQGIIDEYPLSAGEVKLAKEKLEMIRQNGKTAR